MYKRILIKLSGEALKGRENNFDFSIINNIAKQMIKLNNLGYQIGVVIGGGNIWRGANNQIIDRVNSDYIGMLATVMNGIFLSNLLNKLQRNISYVFSKLEVQNLTKSFNIQNIHNKLSKNKIVILAGGTGSPYFTTDTTSVLRAIEIEADILLMAKNGVDGVYDSDPKLNKKAKFFKKISYGEILNKNIKIIDATAATLAKENNIKTLIFNINGENNIYNLLTQNNMLHTIIY